METDNEFRKGKPSAYDDHHGKMLQLHLHGEKHKKAIDGKHVLHSIVRKGNTKAQITTGAKNSEILKIEYNRKVISKFIKTIYLKCRKKWAVKNNFLDVMKHIKYFRDVDLRIFKQWIKTLLTSQNLQLINLLKICSDSIEDIFLYNTILAGEFAILTEETIVEAGSDQLAVFVRYASNS